MAGGIRCSHIIEPGEQYFDPGDSNPESAGGYGGYRYCREHLGDAAELGAAFTEAVK